MPHKYSNFADAYAYLDTLWGTAQAMQSTAYGFCDDADDYANAGNFKWGIRYCVYAIKSTLSAFDILFQNYNFTLNWSAYGELLYWAAQEGGEAEEYDLTARKICEAWAKDGFEDRALTIAFIDRQRQLIWDEPFFVKWAAKPET